MKRKFVYLVIIVCVVSLSCLVYVALGPFISLNGIKKGIEEENQLVLESYVDFPVLRKNISIRAKKQFAESMGFDSSQTGNILANFAMQFAEQMIDVGVDAAISPEGLSLMMAGNDLNDVMLYSKLDKPVERKEKPFPEVIKESEFSYINHSEFEFSFKNQNRKGSLDSSPQKTTLVFYRNGFHWKLADVIFEKQGDTK